MEPSSETPGDGPASARRLRATLRELVSEATGVPEAQLDDARPLVEYGLTSRAAVGLAGRLEQILHSALPATLVWENPTVEGLVRRLSTVQRSAAEGTRGPERQGSVAGTADTEADDDLGDASFASCPIAVIGVGCRLPGGVHGPEAFWKSLMSAGDLVRPGPGRMRRTPFTGAGPAALTARTAQGAFLDDIEAFDAEFFGITPREAEVMDPQQRLLLEVSCEALDHAGLPAHMLEGSDTAVFVGLSALEYGHLTTADPARLTPWTSTGAAGSIAANRLSYLLDLHGPSVTVDTACSSSLVAVHQACRSLLERDCDTALAGGVNVLLSPTITASFDQAGALAADGRCKPFDAAADGIVRGEGCGVVVLKRLADAERDGDRILAVVKGSAVNSDGRSAGLMAPNPAAQERLLRRALENARLEPADIDYVETHGTGTLLGDPMEAGSLGTVFRSGRPADRPLLIGSVKSNLGHLEGAAGIVGLIKTVLALHRHRVPPSLHFRRPNPHIDFADLLLRVVTTPTDWPRRGTRPARAGVSAFGFGGTNAHVVLEETPTGPEGTQDVSPHTEDEHGEAPHVLVVSARSRDRLGDAAVGLARLTAADDAPPLRDVAHTLARHRRGPVCAAVTARTHQEAAGLLATLARGEEDPGLVPPCTDDSSGRSSGARRPVFVFSGYGSQWQGMGARLLRDEPFFATAVEDMDPLYLAETGVRLSDLLDRAAPDAGVEHIQPLLFGMQIALARALGAYGVRPGAVIGHSMGEVSAAVTAGALDLADGLRIILRRSVALAAVDAEGAGAMAAVEVPVEEREAVLARFPGVETAVHSSPYRCTVAGPAHRVRELVDGLTAEGRLARLLDVGGAGHSPAVDPVVPTLREALAGLRPGPGEVPWYTTVLDDPRARVVADAAYWCANLRRPVRLQQAVDAAAADGNDLFLEISPHPVALIPLSETLRAAEGASQPVVIPTLRKRGDEAVDLRSALARLHFAGARLDEDRLWPAGARIALPSPLWRHKRYWFGRGHAVAPDVGNALLGRRTDDPRTGAVLWQTDLGTAGSHAPRRHLHGRPVLTLPAAAALMIEAARELLGHDTDTDLCLEELAVHRWLPVASRTPVTLVWEPDGSHATVTINARGAEGNWHCHASARVLTRPGPPPAYALGGQPARSAHWAPAPDARPQAPAYEDFLTTLLYAPAEAAAPDAAAEPPHSPAAEIVPVAVRSLRLHGRVAGPLSIEAAQAGTGPVDDPVRPSDSPRSMVGWDILADGTGARVVASGVELRPAEGHEVPKPLESLTYDIQWQKSPAPLPGNLDHVLLLTDEPTTGAGGATLAGALNTALEGKNVRTTVGTCSLEQTDRLLQDWLSDTAPQGTSAVVLLLTRQVDPGDARALHMATTVARRLASNAPGRLRPRLWLVTLQGRATAPGEAGLPRLACLRGLVRVLSLEEPALRAGLVDIDTQPDSVEGLVQELLGDSSEDEIAWRAGSRLVARLTGADVTTQQYAVPFVRQDGAYIVTGGLTGLGLATARRLASRGAGRIVLNGRRPPSPQVREVIDRLLDGGVSVAVVQGDIGDPEVATRLVRTAVDEGHALRGVAHCAGLLHDRMISDLRAADIDTVLRPKVMGALHLDRALASHSLDWCVFYSSAAALLGSPGQAAYAAANAWLDALAQSRRAEGRPATSIAWGPWTDAGAAPTEGYLPLESITLSEGLAALQTLVEQNRTHTGVVHLDAERAVEAFPALSTIPFFSDSLRAGPAAGDDWAGPDGIDALGEDAADRVYERLAARTAAIMGFGVRDLDETVPLPALGLDSLVAVRIRNAAQQDFGVELPADLMLRGASLREIGDTVLGRLGLSAAAREAKTPAPRPRTGPTERASSSLPSTIQPRDAAERLVAGAWAEVLHTPPADVRADFVSAGAEPGTADRLVEAIRRRLGDVPPGLTAGEVLSRRSVAAIADLIRPAVNPSSGSAVTTLRPPRPGSGRPALFTFHPAGGPTSVYLPLSRLLPADQAVYGMERLHTQGTMEEKAARYLNLVRDLQPQGPYHLLGWSFGGCLAYETAQQLLAEGETVGFLGLIDTILPAALPGLDSQDVLLERFGRFAEYVKKTYGHELRLPYDELAATPDEQQIDVVMRLVAEAGLDMGPSIMEHQRTSYLDARVGERYSPRPYHGPVVLYRAQQAQRLTTALDPRYLRSDADLGWADFCPDLRIVPVEGDHLSLIDPPHVATIARHLTRELSVSRRSPDQPG
ncbi:SDR family NAD(P)-dependent oxidoreductase [Streptomyces sp. H51]|uniref:SDR family NAD(P)-dependent oxidoreductase n=1 Tax=Streptomyces sp. H51 TaxID=3111770 RepID=UPI002D765588|nr:SDR family NAD(P)-dependent oxidoreductase [Streptomyces sp. H51]